jgi:hypothetical protein
MSAFLRGLDHLRLEQVVVQRGPQREQQGQQEQGWPWQSVGSDAEGLAFLFSERWVKETVLLVLIKTRSFYLLYKDIFFLRCSLKKDFSCLTVCLQYCIEGIEMRQRSCKVRRLLFLKRYYLFQHTAAVFILEQKEGEVGRQQERLRECVCECGSIAQNGLGVCHKTNRWEKPS